MGLVIKKSSFFTHTKKIFCGVTQEAAVFLMGNDMENNTVTIRGQDKYH